MTAGLPVRLLAWMVLSLFALTAAAQAQQAEENAAISAKQLVVMIDGRFPTSRALTSGAGIVVGRKGGLVYIATAGHVVRDLMEEAEDIRVQFPDRPGLEVSATIFPASFDKGIDVALLIVPQSEAPEAIATLDTFPAARMSTEIRPGEGVYLFGQPGGRVWSGNRSPEKVQAARTTEIEVESSTVVPGLSGGATLDEGLRIVGIIVETDNGVARSIPIRFLKEIIESGGYPFMLGDAEAPLHDVEIDPLEELTRRGYSFNSRQGAGIEFMRALDMRREEDARLFIAASVPMEVPDLVLRGVVPPDLVDALLHSDLLSGRDGKPLDEWCDYLVKENTGGNISVALYGRALTNDNGYLLRTACKAQLPALTALLKTSIELHEKLAADAVRDKARKDEITRICREIMTQMAPLETLAEQTYKSARNQPYDPLDTWKAGKDAQAAVHEQLGGGSHIRLDLFKIYDEIGDDVWSVITGGDLVGDTVYYGSKPFKTLAALYAEAAENRIGWQCEERISIVEASQYELQAYHDMQHMLRLLGG